MKRALQVFSSLNKGGAESRVMDLYRLVDKSKVQFDFAVTSAGEGFYMDEIRALGGRIYYVRSWREIGILGWFRQWKHIFADVCLVHSHVGFDNGIVVFVAWLFGVKKRISHARDMLPVSGRFHVQKEALMRWLMVTFSTDLIACSHDSGNFIFGEKAVTSRGYFLPNAIELTKYEVTADFDRMKYRKGLGVSPEAFVLGTVGNLREVKNQLFMIDILAAFRRKKINADLVIAGEGDMRQELEAHARELDVSEYVHLLGQRHDIGQLLRSMDVFLLTSFSEGLPGSAVEAQCANVPCVLASTITRDVDVHGGLVSFVSLEDTPDVWVERILEQASSPKPAREEILALLKKNNFGVQESLNKLLSIYFNNEA